ncbi:uncharacterized protein LOC108832842 [Raphanus sativus]|uniref:Uncharacterized protein LOC108832842 n=1 Tax=Raphanus sativus TaxID=3726 RepID=A0A9W3D969_RAPSA|nr:uncharacterized protein LOC108832842 [Raphanus sativus]
MSLKNLGLVSLLFGSSTQCRHSVCVLSGLITHSVHLYCRFSWQEQFWCRYPDDFLDIAKNRSSYGTRSLVYSWITLCSTFAKLDTHFTSTFSTIQTHGQKGHLISSSLVLKSED